MAIEIRLLQPQEAELANNFFNEIYKTRRSLDNFRWEFFEGPNGQAIYVIAVDTDEKRFTKVVGIQCAIPLELMTNDGTAVLTAKSEDTLVDPGYRGQKIFERMYDVLFQECTKAGIAYIWGFTPALKAFQRLGFETPFKSAQALLVLKPFDAYTYLASLNPENKFTERFKIFALSFISYFSGWRAVGMPKDFTVREVPVSSKEKIISEFYSGMQKSFFLRLNDKYIEWRIFKNPFGNEYKNFQVFDREEILVADVIINIRKDVSYIEQMLFHSRLDQKSKAGIIRHVTTFMAKAKTPLIRTLCFEHHTELKSQIALLQLAGFTFLARGNFFVWKPLVPSVPIKPEEIFLSRLFTQGNA